MNPQHEIERTVLELIELQTEAQGLAQQAKLVRHRAEDMASRGAFDQLTAKQMEALQRLAEARDVPPGRLAKTLVVEGLRREGQLE